MSFQLILAEQRIAEQKMRCDAMQMWLDMHKHCESAKKIEKGLKVWFHARSGIQVQARYIHYEFVDTETAEILEMNTDYKMNKMMCLHKIYPPFILDEIINYYKNHELNKL